MWLFAQTWLYSVHGCLHVKVLEKRMQKNVIEEVEVYNQILHPIDSQKGSFLLKLFLLREQATFELFSSGEDTSASL